MALQCVKQFLSEDKQKQEEVRTIDNTCVNIVYSGSEPITFTTHFNCWDIQISLLSSTSNLVFENQDDKKTQNKPIKKELTNVLKNEDEQKEFKGAYKDYSY